MLVLLEPMFRRNVSPPSSGLGRIHKLEALAVTSTVTSQKMVFFVNYVAQQKYFSLKMFENYENQ
jgi:hypothetical protein